MDTFDRDRNIEVNHGAKTRKQLHSLLLKQSKRSDYTRLIKEAQLFTFVTDPIERFLFAINECYLRNVIPHTLEWKNHRRMSMNSNNQYNDNNPYYTSSTDAHTGNKVKPHDNRNRNSHNGRYSNRNSNSTKSIMKSQQYRHFLKNHQATPATAKAIFNAILTGDTDVIEAHLLTIPSVNHFYPMSNMLREFEPDFVGDFTLLLEQWSKVVMEYTIIFIHHE